MNRLDKKIYAIVFSFLLISSSMSFADLTVEGNMRVLLISSYNPSFSTFYDQIEGIKSVFDDENILLDVEFMDSKRLFTEENINNFYQSLSYKMSSLPEYDAFLVSDDIGLRFVLDYKDNLFKDKPIVFLGINDIDNAISASSYDNITGVVEKASIEETISIALEMNPEARSVFAIIDGTPSSQGDYARYIELGASFANVEFETIDLSKMTFEEYGMTLESIDKESILLLLSAYCDSDSERMEFSEVFKTINSHAKIPVYHPYYHGIGDGLLGGMVISHIEQGKVAASQVLSIFNGNETKSMKLITESPNTYVFDYQVMEKYGYDLSDVPPESILLNYEPSLMSEYGGYILGLLLVLGLEGLLIMYLLINIKKRKTVETKLHDKQKELITANDEITSTYEELYASFEEVELKNIRIQKLINNDELTGLKNRLAITQKIDDLIGLNNKFAIIFIDIDNFKDVNDMFGHNVGDEVIKVTAERIKKLESEDFFVGRFGGDEFLIAYKTNGDDKRLYKVINQIKAAFSEEVLVGNSKFFLTVSIGVVKYPVHGLLQNDLIKKADMALYKAKADGKNSSVVYNEDLNRTMLDKINLQQIIKEGFSLDKFDVYFQPIIDPITNKAKIFEALIRYHHDELGYISPLDLITNAEEMGLINEIGNWVISKSFAFLKELNELSEELFTISINISALQLKYSGFVEEILSKTKEFGIEPSQICLEVTETVFLESIIETEKTLLKLKKYGFNVSLDDFGTGYSSLEYLNSLPVDILKIDKKFVANMLDNEFDHLLVEIMIKLAKKREMKVVAEGVEEENQLEELKKLGCDFIQGYYYSKALPEAEIKPFLKKHLI